MTREERWKMNFFNKRTIFLFHSLSWGLFLLICLKHYSIINPVGSFGSKCWSRLILCLVSSPDAVHTTCPLYLSLVRRERGSYHILVLKREFVPPSMSCWVAWVLDYDVRGDFFGCQFNSFHRCISCERHWALNGQWSREKRGSWVFSDFTSLLSFFSSLDLMKCCCFCCCSSRLRRWILVSHCLSLHFSLSFLCSRFSLLFFCWSIDHLVMSLMRPSQVWVMMQG